MASDGGAPPHVDGCCRSSGGQRSPRASMFCKTGEKEPAEEEDWRQGQGTRDRLRRIAVRNVAALGHQVWFGRGLIAHGQPRWMWDDRYRKTVVASQPSGMRVRHPARHLITAILIEPSNMPKRILIDGPSEGSTMDRAAVTSRQTNTKSTTATANHPLPQPQHLGPTTHHTQAVRNLTSVRLRLAFQSEEPDPSVIAQGQ
jgi:hypothetical protein